MNNDNPLLVTRSRLVKDFIDLGVQPSATVMLHASIKAVGWVVGGPDVVLNALQEVLWPAGHPNNDDRLGRQPIRPWHVVGREAASVS